MSEYTNNKKWLALIIVCIGSFMTTMDINIVNVALPRMAERFSVGMGTIQWVITSYLLAISALVLIFGRLADIKGKKLIYQNGFLIFSLGSLMCSFSTTLWFLILSRILQAIGASMMMSSNFGIITMVFPQSENGRAVGILGSVVAVAAMIGPSLGGFLVGLFNWQSIFIINIPVGIAAFMAGPKILPLEYSAIKNKTLDLKGAVFFVLFIIPIFLAILNGENVGWLSPYIIFCFIFSLLNLILFLIVEYKVPSPILDLFLFKNSAFSSGIFCAYISYTVIYFTNIIHPFFLQHILSMSPEKAGLIMMVYPATSAIVAPLGGYITDKIGYKTPTLIGLISTGIGIFSMSFLNLNCSNADIIVRMSILGFGYGLFQSPNSTGVMTSVPKDKLGISGSINSFIRTLGMSSGISFSVALFYKKLSLILGYHVSNSANIDPGAFAASMKFVYIIGTIIALCGIAAAFLRLMKKDEYSIKGNYSNSNQ